MFFDELVKGFARLVAVSGLFQTEKLTARH